MTSFQFLNIYSFKLFQLQNARQNVLSVWVCHLNSIILFMYTNYFAFLCCFGNIFFYFFLENENDGNMLKFLISLKMRENEILF